MPKIFDIEKFNSILIEHGQTTIAISITGDLIVLSNGVVIDDRRSVKKCKKRVMQGHPIWKTEFDNLYNLDLKIRKTAEEYARKQTSKAGGVACQQKNGSKIRNNLNCGIPWNKGLKGKYPYSRPHDEISKSKISAANSGPNNGMYGKKMSEFQKQHRSKVMKQKILSGQFTPNSNNRNTHWDAYYKGKKYRSSWESLYQYFDNLAEYEILRIPYEFENQEFVYITDFVNHTTKQIIEVKPTEMLNNKKTSAKISAAKKWCRDHGYEFVLADKKYFLDKGFPNSLNEFDIRTQHKIIKLYETKK